MKLNQATDYAFRMVLHMALLPSGSKITGAVLAEQELIPERFLLKIMRSEAMGVIQHQLVNQLEAVNFKNLAQREQLIIAEA